MIKFPKLKAITAAAGVCALASIATPASAFVYSTSHLQIEELTLTFAPTTTPSAFTFNLDNSAVLNGALTSSTATCNSVGFPACSPGSPVLDASVVNASGSAPLRAENVFTFNGPNGVNTLSNADSVINSAQLVQQGVPTSTEQIAESLLNINGTASAQAEIQSNTSLSASFTGGGTVSLSFLADPDQLSEIGGGQTGTFLSQSNLNATFTLTNSAGGSINFTPNGDGTNSCIISGPGFAGVTCAETADTQDLNQNTSTSINPGVSSNSFEAADVLTAFGISIDGLANDVYQVVFNANTSTSIVNVPNAVPEPGTTGLIGAALAGLALTTLRRKRKSV